MTAEVLFVLTGATLGRLWLSRVVWLVVIAVAATLILHLRTAYVLEGDPADFANRRQVFSWGEYRRQVTAYVSNLRRGRVEYYSVRGTKQQFMPVLKDGFLASLKLFLTAGALGTCLGMLVGCLVALRHWLPRSVSLSISVGSMAVPDFLLVLGAQAIAIWTYGLWDWKPWTVLADPGATRGMLLPAVVLTLLPMGYAARLTASAMDEIMRQDYIRTARSKGVHEAKVILGHALRNAVTRVLSGMPAMLNLVLSSMIVVEHLTVFPGMGRWMAGNVHLQTTIGPQGTQIYWAGAVPQIVATAGAVYVAWFLLMDGLANTVRLLANRRLQEVGR